MPLLYYITRRCAWGAGLLRRWRRSHQVIRDLPFEERCCGAGIDATFRGHRCRGRHRCRAERTREALGFAPRARTALFFRGAARKSIVTRRLVDTARSWSDGSAYSRWSSSPRPTSALDPSAISYRLVQSASSRLRALRGDVQERHDHTGCRGAGCRCGAYRTSRWTHESRGAGEIPLDGERVAWKKSRASRSGRLEPARVADSLAATRSAAPRRAKMRGAR